MEKLSYIVLGIVLAVMALAVIVPDGAVLIAQFLNNVLAVVVGIALFLFLYGAFKKDKDK